MKVRPLHDKVLIKIIEAQETTKGGIIIPDTAKDTPQQGEVIAVGNGKILEDGSTKKLDVKKGDKVLFSKFGGTDISIDNQNHLILSEEEILAIVE